MKLKIHDGLPHESDTVYLSLIEVDPDHIMLAAVDDSGGILLDDAEEKYGGGLLTITREGRVSLSPAVMPSLGFPLDVDHRLTLDSYSEKMTAKRAQRFGGKRAAFRVVP